MKYAFVLGRQPKLSLAELESVYGANSLASFGKDIALVDLDTEPSITRLGGSQKIALVLKQASVKNFEEAWPIIEKIFTEKVKNVDAKCNVGISVYGVKVSAKILQNKMIEFKHNFRKSYKTNIRIVGSGKSQLSSAQVLHNNLDQSPNLEIIAAFNRNQLVLCQTVAIQNINFYSKRDHGRPKRDARVGMLPPKLAQIMINLSGVKEFGILWDPFCGTGVLLQEALLMNIDVYGSDIDPRMVEYANVNLNWLKKNYGHNRSMQYSLSVADATKLKLEPEHKSPIQHIASEIYLGPPLRVFPGEKEIEIIKTQVDEILEKFLLNVCGQLKSGARLCLAVPVWWSKNKLLHLKTVDRLESLGYTRLSFSHANNNDLIYRRFNQVVGRELLVMKRK